MKRDLELFSDDGHLTGEGLRALVDETLTDEMQRLEAAEHLGFCDACLLRYTDMLTDDVLTEPQAPLLPEVQRGLRRRKLRVAFGRYATVAAAACLAVTMWAVGSGLFSGTGALKADDAKPVDTAEPSPSLSRRISDGLDNVSAGVSQFFSAFSPTVPDEATAQQGQQDRLARSERTRQWRERLFGDNQQDDDTTDKDDTTPPDPDSAAGQ